MLPRHEAPASGSPLVADRSEGLSGRQAAELLKRDGPNEIPEERSHPVLQLARKFWGLSAWMLELIAVLSFVLGKSADLAIAVALLLINATLSFHEERRAAGAVTALRRRLQVTARVLRDGIWRAMPARQLVAGDLVRVRSGDFIPADARIIDGALQVDQSALTGESRELRKGRDDLVFSGSIVRHGEATAIIVSTGMRTYFGRTTYLVESAHPRLHIEQVVSRIVRWLFLIVGAMVLLAIAVSYMRGLSLLSILPLSLVLLISAVPVSLPVMFSVSMAIGSIELARRGVLVTRLSAVEDAANMDVLLADKTGTLTLNRLTLVGAIPEPGSSIDDVIRDGALASNAADQDPIDVAFLRAAGERSLLPAGLKVLDFRPFSPQTRRTEALIEVEGQRMRVTKGALRTIAEAAGCDPAATTALEVRAETEAGKGFRVLAVARADGAGALRLVGLALLSDPPRPDSRRLITRLRELGVTVKMLTGDSLLVAQPIAHQLGLGNIIRPAKPPASGPAADMIRSCDGLAEIFPEAKYRVVESLQSGGHVVAMTGDGVNDAPALRQAEVGIAVSTATDVAKGAASVVLTTEGLGGIVDLVTNGRSIYQRVLTWIINKLAETVLKAGLVVIAFLATGKFVISALGMLLLVFLSDFVKIALSLDRARPSSSPETWHIGYLLKVAVILGVLMLAEALGLLAIGWRWFQLAADPGRLETFTFETLLFFSLLLILCVRERRAFWASRPSATLMAVILAGLCSCILISIHGLATLQPLPLTQTAFVLAYAIFFSLAVNDPIKTLLIARRRRTRGPAAGASKL